MSWMRNMSILVAKIKYWLWTNTQQFSSNLVGVRMLVLVFDHLCVCKAMTQNLDYTCSVCLLCYAHLSQCVKLNRSSICEVWRLVLCLLCCPLPLGLRSCPEGHPSYSHVPTLGSDCSLFSLLPESDVFPSCRKEGIRQQHIFKIHYEVCVSIFFYGYCNCVFSFPFQIAVNNPVGTNYP